MRVAIFPSSAALLHSHTEVRRRCQIFRRREVAINSLGAQKYLRHYACICCFTAAFERLALEPNKISSHYLPGVKIVRDKNTESFSHGRSYLYICWLLFCPSRDSTLLLCEFQSHSGRFPFLLFEVENETRCAERPILWSFLCCHEVYGLCYFCTLSRMYV